MGPNHLSDPDVTPTARNDVISTSPLDRLIHTSKNKAVTHFEMSDFDPVAFVADTHLSIRDQTDD